MARLRTGLQWAEPLWLQECVISHKGTILAGKCCSVLQIRQRDNPGVPHPLQQAGFIAGLASASYVLPNDAMVRRGKREEEACSELHHTVFGRIAHLIQSRSLLEATVVSYSY